MKSTLDVYGMHLCSKILAHYRFQRIEKFCCLTSTFLTSLSCLFSFFSFCISLYSSLFLPFFFFASDQKYYSEFKRKVLMSQVLSDVLRLVVLPVIPLWGVGGRNLHSQELCPHPQRGEQMGISSELSRLW